MVTLSVSQVHAEWTIETISQTSNGEISARSLVFDGAGNPHVAYMDRGGNQPGSIKYAKRVDSTWSIQVVDPGSVSSNGQVLSMGPSIALDSSSNPHVIYYTWITPPIDKTHMRLKYAKKLSGGGPAQYTFKDVSLTSEWVHRGAIALTPSGTPIIVYVCSLEDQPYKRFLRYAKWTGTQFERGTIESLQGSSSNQKNFRLSAQSLVIDSSGNIHIGYKTTEVLGTLTNVKYAKGATSGGSISWSFQTLETANDSIITAPDVSLALDSSGKPRIAYFGKYRYLKYAKMDGSSWSISIAGGGLKVSAGLQATLSLALTASNDTVHISYVDGGLIYTKKQGQQAWSVEDGPTFESVDGPSIAVNTSGNPSMIYESGIAIIEYAAYYVPPPPPPPIPVTSVETGTTAGIGTGTATGTGTSTGTGTTTATTGSTLNIKPTDIKTKFDKGPFPPIDPPKQ